MIRTLTLPLKFWQDPQGDVVLTFSETICQVQYNCWTDDGDEADHGATLVFSRAIAVRSIHTDLPPYAIPTHSGHSFVLVVLGSDWLAQAKVDERLSYGRHTSDRFSRKHFVVLGHDVYHEVLAESFEEAKSARIDT